MDGLCSLLIEDEDEGDLLTPGLIGDCENEFDREGGHPDEVDDTENAEVRQVDGVSTVKSQGEDEADDECAPDDAEDTEPREEWTLPALDLPFNAGDRSFPGSTRTI